MPEHKNRCIRCGIIVTSTTAFPDRQLGGPCPKDSSGNHSWTRA